MKVVVVLAVAASGCSSSPPPHSATAPVQAPPPADPEHIVSGAADTVGTVPGSPNALYIYRFKQIEPASDRFSFQDRNLSFYFRPSPTALYFQVENRQDRPVWIEWDRSQFLDSFGTPRRLANAETRWQQRFAPLAPTQIPGLQRHGNYVFPIDLLIDPGGSDEQLHRPLFPEDQTAPQYIDREFGIVLVFRTNEGLEPYTFRFRVRSVVPR